MIILSRIMLSWPKLWTFTKCFFTFLGFFYMVFFMAASIWSCHNFWIANFKQFQVEDFLRVVGLLRQAGLGDLKGVEGKRCRLKFMLMMIIIMLMMIMMMLMMMIIIINIMLMMIVIVIMMIILMMMMITIKSMAKFSRLQHAVAALRVHLAGWHVRVTRTKVQRCQRGKGSWRNETRQGPGGLSWYVLEIDAKLINSMHFDANYIVTSYM